MSENDLTKLVNPLNEKGKVHIKESISIGLFLGYVSGLISFLAFAGRIKWLDFADTGFLVFCWAIAFAILLVMGVGKPSLMKLSTSIARVAFNPDFSMKVKFGIIINMIMNLFGLIVNMSDDKSGLSQMVNTMQKQIEESKAETVIDPKSAGLNPNPFPAPASIPPAEEKK